MSINAVQSAAPLTTNPLYQPYARNLHPHLARESTYSTIVDLCKDLEKASNKQMSNKQIRSITIKLTITDISRLALAAKKEEVNRYCAITAHLYQKDILNHSQFLQLILPTISKGGFSAVANCTYIGTNQGAMQLNSLVIMSACKVSSIFQKVAYPNVLSIGFEALRLALSPLPCPTSVNNWIMRARHFSNALLLTREVSKETTNGFKEESILDPEFIAGYIATTTKELSFYPNELTKNIILFLEKERVGSWAPRLLENFTVSLKINYLVHHPLQPCIQRQNTLIFHVQGFSKFLVDYRNYWWKTPSYLPQVISSLQLPPGFEEAIACATHHLGDIKNIQSVHYEMPKPAGYNFAAWIQRGKSFITHCQQLFPHLEKIEIVLPSKLDLAKLFHKDSILSIFPIFKKAFDSQSHGQLSKKKIELICSLDAKEFTSEGAMKRYVLQSNEEQLIWHDCVPKSPPPETDTQKLKWHSFEPSQLDPTLLIDLTDSNEPSE